MAAASAINNRLIPLPVEIHEHIHFFSDSKSSIHLSATCRTLRQIFFDIKKAQASAHWHGRSPIPRGVSHFDCVSMQTLRMGNCVVFTLRLGGPSGYTVQKIIDLRTCGDWPVPIPGLGIGTRGCFLGDARRVTIVKLDLDDAPVPDTHFTGSATCFSCSFDGVLTSRQIPAFPPTLNLDPNAIDLGTLDGSWVTDGERIFINAPRAVKVVHLESSALMSFEMQVGSIRCGGGLLVANHFSKEGGAKDKADIHIAPTTAASAAAAPLKTYATIEGTVVSPVTYNHCLVRRGEKRYLVNLSLGVTDIELPNRGAVSWDDQFFVCTGNDCLLGSTYLRLFTIAGEFVRCILLPEAFRGRIISKLEIVGETVLVHARGTGGKEDFCVLTFPAPVEVPEAAVPDKKQ